LELQHLVRSDCWNLNWDRNAEVPMLANLLIWRLIAIPLVVATILAFMFLFSVGYFQLKSVEITKIQISLLCSNGCCFYV